MKYILILLVICLIGICSANTLQTDRQVYQIGNYTTNQHINVRYELTLDSPKTLIFESFKNPYQLSNVHMTCTDCTLYINDILWSNPTRLYPATNTIKIVMNTNQIVISFSGVKVDGPTLRKIAIPKCPQLSAGTLTTSIDTPNGKFYESMQFTNGKIVFHTIRPSLNVTRVYGGEVMWPEPWWDIIPGSGRSVFD